MIGKIEINGIKVHAYHGCMDEEAIIGTNFIIDVIVRIDISDAVETDNLKHTVDYVSVSKLVQKEMNIRSKLIETVASRILNSLQLRYPIAEKIIVKLTKIAPPAKGMIENVCITVEG